jgi:hypothetical protein
VSDTPVPPTEPDPNAPPDTADAASPVMLQPTLGERALAVFQAERVAGHKADPPDFHSGARVKVYFQPCVRGGKLLGITSGNWCAASASWAFYTAVAEEAKRQAEDIGLQDPIELDDVALAWSAASWQAVGYPPFGYRAAVSELVADAKLTSAWVDVAEMAKGHMDRKLPKRGDLLIFARAGGDPRTGGTGHVVLVEAPGKLDPAGNVVDAEDAWVVVSGNAPGGTIAREVRTMADTVEHIVGFIAVG